MRLVRQGLDDVGVAHDHLNAQIALKDLRLIFAALNEASSVMYDLRRAVAPLLMMTFRSLPTFDKIFEGQCREFRAHAGRVLALLSERQNDVDSLLKDALTRHRHVTGDAPTA